MNNLIWNSFKEKPRSLPYADIGTVLPHDKEVFLFLEREKELYRTNHLKILTFVENIEPWDNVDGYIFDETLQWVIALTHEEILLLLGI